MAGDVVRAGARNRFPAGADFRFDYRSPDIPSASSALLGTVAPELNGTRNFNIKLMAPVPAGAFGEILIKGDLIFPANRIAKETKVDSVGT